jgi:hypothetical protein
LRKEERKGEKKMNEKDLKELRERKEREDEEKLMEAIHKKHRAVSDDYLLRAQVAKIKREKAEKRASFKNKFMIVLGLAAAVIAFIALLNAAGTDADFIKECEAAGNSSSVCEEALGLK